MPHVHSYAELLARDAGEATKSAKLMRLASILSLSVAMLLVIIKAIAWWMTDSLSLLSSLMDSLLDILASLVNFIAIRYALQPPDAEHRFGHGKAEDLAALAQATFIAGSGLFIFIEAMRRIVSPSPIAEGMVGIGVMTASIVLTLALVLFQRYVAKRTRSGVIATDALHYFMDLLTNLAVIVALILSQQLGWHMADPLFAIGIAFYIVHGAWGVGRKALDNLMDREFLDDERQKVKDIIRRYTEVLGIHDLKTRQSGIHAFIQCHVEMDGNLTLKESHAVVDRIEDALMKAYPHAEVILHQDPKR